MSVAHSSEIDLAFRAAQEICRRHARSFYFASTFLPKERRSAAYAVYAFCRMLDDAIDEAEPACSSCGPTSELEEKLQMFRDRLDQIYTDRLNLPAVELRDEQQHALLAFARTVSEYGIPKQYFLDLAEGCAMDLTISRYATWAKLEKYCYHVAGVVGLIMCGVFGVTSSDAGRHAVAMGNAMQLTNILRDVKEDYDRGRIYLPLEDMARFGYTEDDLKNGVVNDAFRALMRFEIDRARTLYTEGAAGLCYIADSGSRFTGSVMASVYSGILDAIERQNYDVYSKRAALSLPRKVARLPMAWRWASRAADEPMVKVF